MRGILTYHSIDGSGSPVSVAPEDFARHVRWLADSSVEVLGLDELLERPADANACAITFDDAFLNFQDTAWPLLREHGLPVTLFVVSGHAGGTNAWGGEVDVSVPTLPLMDWPGLAAVADEGVTLGAHTVTHPHLPALSQDGIEEEMAACRSQIEEHAGRVVTAFAYPYGDVDERVVQTAGRHFRTAVTTRLASLSPNDTPRRLPRLDAFYFRDPGRLESWGTARFERYVAFRRGLRRIRRTLSRGSA